MAEDFSSGNIKKLPDEIKDRLYEQFDSLNRNFKIAFGGLVLFSLIFFYLIFIPVVRINTDRAEILYEKIASDTLLRNSKINLHLITTTEMQIERLQERLSKISPLLEDFIIRIRQGKLTDDDLTIISSVVLPGINSGSVDDSISMVQYRLGRYLEKYFLLTINVHRDSILTYARISGSKFSVSFDTTTFITRIDSVHSILHRVINQTELYTVMGPRLKLVDTINVIVKNSLDEFEEQVERLIRTQNKQTEIDSQNIDSLNKKLLFLEGREKEIAEKIGHIEFPVGSLPVTLHESIELFPILLTVGLIISMYLFISIIDLRETFIENYLKPAYTDLNERDFSVALPIWLNPDLELRKQIFQSLFLMVPLFVFIGTVSLTLMSMRDLKALAKINYTEVWLYQELITGLIYVLCSVAYLMIYLQVFSRFQWRKRKERRRNGGLDFPVGK